MTPLTMEKPTMKFKKLSRTLCALSAVALSILCVCVPGSAFTYRGGEHGIVTLNDWDYDFFTYIDTNLMTGEYQSVCISDAAGRVTQYRDAHVRHLSIQQGPLSYRNIKECEVCQSGGQHHHTGRYRCYL